MKIFKLLPIFLTLCNALAIKRQTTCEDPAVRKEWRSLTDSEKSNYLEAVQCLKTTPSRLSNSNSTSLFDDFPNLHRQLDLEIHLVGVFLPWHRWFIQLYEDALRDECNYTGYATYWDWSLDYQDPFSSAVFDAELGFGGDGDSSTGCVTDGPFKDLQVSTPNDHCLQRSFTASVFEEYASPGLVNETLDIGLYSLFRPALENGLHRSAHGGLGGDMLQNYSPNDPIFYLHHGNIDRIWWEWQSVNSSRQTEYGGNRYQDDAATEATLQDEVPMIEDFIDESQAVENIMWVQSGRFCYTYDS
ncbi:monooxygenase [Dactylonectria estremocensis]|uniref:Monooxygenase n=1 Tax=Dactylonectria estremocensis TaxID=1079267 RepID=A0A9P9IDE3_9HYPO|nr:monooxygenase [Dactylonectria estremocensis]